MIVATKSSSCLCYFVYLYVPSNIGNCFVKINICLSCHVRIKCGIGTRINILYKFINNTEILQFTLSCGI